MVGSLASGVSGALERISASAPSVKSHSKVVAGAAEGCGSGPVIVSVGASFRLFAELKTKSSDDDGTSTQP